MSQPFISIVVPVFNEQEHLKQCLDSICDQNIDVDLLEVIVVDDESSDKSPEIASGYKDKLTHFRYLRNKKNIGLGLSRNEGMRWAKGQFIMFLDSDDWLDSKALSAVELVLRRDNPDLLVFNHFSYYHDGRSIAHSPRGLVRDGLPQPFQLSKQDFQIIRSFHVAWNKIFKRDWANSIPLSYPKGNYEDLGCTYIALTEAASISVIPEPIHYYRHHPDSVPGRPNRKSKNVVHEHVFLRYETVFDYLEKRQNLDKFGAQIYAKMLNQYISIYCERLDSKHHNKTIFRSKLYRHAEQFEPARPIFFSRRDRVIFYLVKVRCLWLLKVVYSLKSLLS